MQHIWGIALHITRSGAPEGGMTPVVDRYGAPAPVEMSEAPAPHHPGPDLPRSGRTPGGRLRAGTPGRGDVQRPAVRCDPCPDELIRIPDDQLYIVTPLTP